MSGLWDCTQRDFDAEKRAKQDRERSYSIFEGPAHGMSHGWQMCVHKTRIDSRTEKLHTWYRRWWDATKPGGGEIEEFSARDVPDEAFLPGRRPSDPRKPRQAEPTNCIAVYGRSAGLQVGWCKCTHDTETHDNGQPKVWYEYANVHTLQTEKYWPHEVPDTAWLPGHKPISAQDVGGSSRAKKREHELEASGKEPADETGEVSSKAKNPKQNDSCCVCFDGNKTHLFAPCGHKCVCATCAAKIMERDARCPMCRAKCSMFVRVFG
jgi:hypothetical protein